LFQICSDDSKERVGDSGVRWVTFLLKSFLLVPPFACPSVASRQHVAVGQHLSWAVDNGKLNW
jgi:hypothetical protein